MRAKEAPHHLRDVRPVRVAEGSWVPAQPAVLAVFGEERLDEGAPLRAAVLAERPSGALGAADAHARRRRGIDAEAVRPGVAQTVGGLDVHGGVATGVHDENGDRAPVRAHGGAHGRRHLVHGLEDAVGALGESNGRGGLRVGDAGHRCARGDAVRMRHHHGHRHAGAGGEPRHVDATGVDGELLTDVFDDTPQVLYLAGARSDLAAQPPTPAVLHAPAAVAGHERVNHGESPAIGQRVEVRDVLDVAVALPAAVQHHDQRQGTPCVVAGREVNQVVPGPRARI